MRVGTLLFVCLAISACSDFEIKPGESPNARRNIPPGAGVLTGEKGEFVIFHTEDRAGAEQAGSDEEKQK